MKNSGSLLFFGFELVLLLFALGNCFVPGSWASFWWTECGWLASAAVAATISLAGMRRAEEREPSPFLSSKQSLAFLLTVFLVVLLILTLTGRLE